MAIQVHLDEVLKARGMTAKELCTWVGITEANLSILRSGKAKGVRFGTINRICYYKKNSLEVSFHNFRNNRLKNINILMHKI